MSPRLLFVHAHPDDETINNGATIARYAAAGADVREQVLDVLALERLREEGRPDGLEFSARSGRQRDNLVHLRSALARVGRGEQDGGNAR